MAKPRNKPTLTLIHGSLGESDPPGSLKISESGLGRYGRSCERHEEAGRLFPDLDSHGSEEAVTAAKNEALTVEQGVRYLSQRDHSEFELRAKLRRKALPDIAIDAALVMFKEQGLQCDERFAENFVRSRVRRCYGPIRIRQDLMQRGVADATIEEALTFSTDYWLDIAEQAVDKKFGNLDAIRNAGRQDDQGAWNKVARFLYNKGFPSDLIYRTLQT